MSLLAGHGDWLAALRAGADQPPRRPRLPLWWQDHAIGTVEPGFLDQIGLYPPSNGPEALQKAERNGLSGWLLQGDLTASLGQLALALRAAGLAHTWRDEQLGVHDGQGRMLGTVERAVVRVLGISTHAVHLMATAPHGGHWLQQRAFNKPNDPGLWDTLMGGMVPASDSLAQALERETWEEAGLRPAQLDGLVHGGRFLTRRPAGDGQEAGYVVEFIDWFRCELAEGVVPSNQDGEVQEFRLMAPAEVVQRLLAGQFTTEAALILADCGL
ncbi:NUDIX domain-containing protein [uncultured Ramlibacter sp.]|uniref:NUDIX hydrolase n=1 Tax=uncultured Ramlibacter sp. TaxID=260755 RepID=UPI00262ACE8F|nr:NUDIX domain-containing protein [uncultured Ramlibacter sp.]